MNRLLAGALALAFACLTLLPLASVYVGYVKLAERTSETVKKLVSYSCEALRDGTVNATEARALEANISSIISDYVSLLNATIREGNATLHTLACLLNASAGLSPAPNLTATQQAGTCGGTPTGLASGG